MPALGEVVIGVRADTGPARAELAALKGQIAGMGGAAGAGGAAAVAAASRRFTDNIGTAARRIGTAGRALTWRMTLPLVALGTATVKSANTFEQSFARINAIAGKIGMSTADAQERVKDLAVRYGQAPQELADALYFVASAGVKAADVMSVVEQSAQGAATGLADSATIAQMLTTVMNNYGQSGFTAEQGLNVLTAAIKKGKAEPEDLANSLSNVIPQASALGISFASMAAAVAQGTNAGLSAARASTGLRFILGSLQRPTDSAKRVLKEYGLTVEDLQDKFKTLGATGGIQYLSELFDTTTTKGKEAFAVLMGGQRGLIIANALIGENFKSAKQIEDFVTRKVNSKMADDAFAKATKTEAFKFKQAMATFKVAAINLGNTLVPILTNDVLPVIMKLVKAFDNLSPETKSKIVWGGIFLAMLGPALSLLSVVLRIWQAVRLIKEARLITGLLGLKTGPIAAASGGAGTAAAGGAAAASAGSILTPILIATIVAAVAAYVKGKRDDAVNNEFSDPTKAGVPQSGRPNPPVVEAIGATRTPIGYLIQWVFGGEDRWRRSRDEIVGTFTYASDATREWVKTMLKWNYMTEDEANAIAAAISNFEGMGLDLDKIEGTGTTTRRELLEAALAAGDVARALQLMVDWVKITTRGLENLYVSTAGLQAAGLSKPSGIGGQAIDPGSRAGEHGLITGMERGGFIVTRPTFIRRDILTGEKRKKEAVIPLEDVRGRRVLAGAMADAMGGASRGTVVVNVAGKVERPEDIKREMDWWLRSRGL